MKKLFCLAAAGAMILAACQSKNAYTVTGTIAGLNDGDTVLIQKIVEREWIATDTAVIANGKFQFKGESDTTEVRYITFNANGRTGAATIFLEKGNIAVSINEEGKKEVTGTANNDIYNAYMNQADSLIGAMYAFYESYTNDTTLTAEQRAANDEKVNAMQKEAMVEFPLATVKENITNPVGIFILSRQFSYFDEEALSEVMANVPAQYQNAPEIEAVSKYLEALQRSAIGQHFTDFEMQTPEGETVKLSDFIGQNKVTLIDFWASWCGPCRKEMPNVVAAYKEFHQKGFGIVGVSLDNNVEAWKKAIVDLDITWPQMSDLKGWMNEGAQLYAVRSIPSTLLVDENGIIVAKNVRGEEIKAKLSELLK